MTFTDIKQSSYFTTLALKKHYIEIMSMNTFHTWKIDISDGCYDLFHSHSIFQNYHYQTSFGNLDDLTRYIKEHDIYQLRGRKNQRIPVYALNLT